MRARYYALLAPYRGLHRNVRLIVGAWLFAFLGASMGGLFFNFYLQELGFDQGFVGLFNAVSPFVAVLFGVPSGMLADRLGHRAAIRAGGVLAVIGFWGIVASATQTALLAWMALVGAGTVLIFTSSAPLLTASATRAQRTAAFSLESATYSLTYLAGNLLGGPLPRWLGSLIGAEAHSVPALRLTLGAAALCLTVGLIPLAFVQKAPHLEEPPPPPSSADPAPGPVRVTHPARLFFWLLLPNFVVAFGAGPIIPFLNQYLRVKFNLSFESIGAVFAWSSVVTMVGVLAQPHLAARFGKVRSVVFVQAVSIPFLLLLGFAPWFWVVAAAMGVRSALMNMGSPVYQAFCMDHVPVRLRATFTGLWQSCWSIGWGLGTLGSGWLQDTMGQLRAFTLLFGTMTAFYLLSIALLWWLWGRERNSTGGGEVREATASPS